MSNTMHNTFFIYPLIELIDHHSEFHPDKVFSKDSVIVNLRGLHFPHYTVSTFIHDSFIIDPDRLRFEIFYLFRTSHKLFTFLQISSTLY